MVDAQQTGMAHVGAQGGDERRKALPPQHQRIDRRQTPILSGAAQEVGRSADRGADGNQSWSAQASAPLGWAPTARSR